MNRDNSEEDKKSESKSRESSYIETDKDRGSVGTFQHKTKLFKGIEQSEIEKPANMDSELTSTIRGAFNQVASIIEAHEFRFNKGKHRKKNKVDRSRAPKVTIHH